MDHDREINQLSAETFAIQSVLIHVLGRLSLLDARFHSAIKLGFDDAARETEDLAIKRGEATPPKHLVKALRVIEELRTATLGNPDKPRGGV